MQPVSRATRAARSLAGVLAPAILAPALLAAPVQARPAPEGFADLAERVLPAVVNISTTQTVKAGGGDGDRSERGPERPQFPPGSPFEDFFREFFDRQQRPNQAPRKVQSLGSGFVIDAGGFVMTNNHVIKDADEIVVRFADDTQLDAKIVGRDEKTDLALLKVESKKPLTALKWGNSDQLRVGDWVIAIGNPFGLGGSVTAGIISARARDINAGPYDDFLQTDASINRGNSGGPMLNMDGEVVGINTAIFSPSGGSVGIGFAVPAALAQPVQTQLKEFGRTRRGWLGVRIQSVSDEIADSLGIKGGAKGALVASVTPGGPAEKAGIEAGDVVLTFDGKEVGRMRKLPRIVADTAINAKVPVEIWRKGKTVKVQVSVGELPDDDKLAAATKPQGEREPAGPKSTDFADLGVSLSSLSGDTRQRYEVQDGTKGVVVTDVKSGGAAAEKGVRTGDVIVEVNQEAVASPTEVAAKVKAARDSGRKSVLLLIDRKGDLSFVAIGVSKG